MSNKIHDIYPLLLCNDIITNFTKEHEQHFYIDKKKIGPFLIHKIVAKGGVGKVYEVSFCCSEKRFAAKFIPYQYIASFISKEIAICRLIHHPNIVQFYDIVKIEKKKQLVLLMELVKGQDLFYWLDSLKIKKNHSLQSFREKLFIFNEIVLTLEFLWGKKILHRDIKLENILYDAEHQKVKICDFGLSVFLQNKNSPLTQVCGSVEFMAPEIFAGIYKGESSMVWSLGIMLYTLCFGSYPFWHQNKNVLIKKIKKGKYLKPSLDKYYDFKAENRLIYYLNENFHELISQMLCMKSESRIHLKDIRNHSFFLLSYPLYTNMSLKTLITMGNPSILIQRFFLPFYKPQKEMKRSMTIPFVPKKQQQWFAI